MYLWLDFPNHSVEKWKDILIKNNYVVIIIEQDSHGKKDPKRTITEIVSPELILIVITFPIM